jgi:hypothetical protein
MKDTSPVSFTTASTSTHSAEVKSVLPRSIDLALLPRCGGSGERGSQLGDAVPVPGTKGGRCEPTPSGFDLVFRVSPRRDARLHAYGSRVLHTVLYLLTIRRRVPGPISAGRHQCGHLTMQRTRQLERTRTENLKLRACNRLGDSNYLTNQNPPCHHIAHRDSHHSTVT